MHSTWKKLVVISVLEIVLTVVSQARVARNYNNIPTIRDRATKYLSKPIGNSPRLRSLHRYWLDVRPGRLFGIGLRVSRLHAGQGQNGGSYSCNFSTQRCRRIGFLLWVFD